MRFHHADYPARPRKAKNREPGERKPSRGETLRTFVAVFPPESVQEALGKLETDLAPKLSGLHWSATRNLHFTLRFFGDLTREEIERAEQVVSAVARQAVAFEVTLSGLGVFPGWKRPRVLWVGVTQGSAILEALARTLERGFRDVRLGRADKSFRAHLTLGRWRDSRELESGPAKAACDGVADVGSFLVEEVAVVKSVLTPQGPLYEPLHRARLRQSGSGGSRPEEMGKPPKRGELGKS